MKVDLKPLSGGKALVHWHCHQKAFGAMKSLRKVPAYISEFEFAIIDASCCGMSGSFGLEVEHYTALVAMGELGLLPAVCAATADSLIVVHGSGRQAIHVAVLLQRALD